jgi:hypothetical protein
MPKNERKEAKPDEIGLVPADDPVVLLRVDLESQEVTVKAGALFRLLERIEYLEKQAVKE